MTSICVSPRAWPWRTSHSQPEMCDLDDS